METMIYIIGTVHVVDIKEKVKKEIKAIKPDAVAIELDEERYNRLMNSPPPSLRNPQELIARLYGARAGDDMRGGVEGAKEVNAKLYLIDEDIREVYKKLEAIKEDPRATIRRFLENFPQVFKLSSSYIRAVLQSFKVLLSKGKKEALKALMDFFIADVEKNPKLYRELPQLLSPAFNQLLLNEREEHMEKEIRAIALKHEKVVGVTGLAHLYGLKNLLKDLEVKCIPVSKLIR
jgi:pheromone shutdown protein TraB